MKDLRIGDVVAVTARVTRLRGDGGAFIEPVGFDFTVSDGVDEVDSMEVDFFTVDEPTLVRRGLMPGDDKWASDGEHYRYHADLGNGLHLLNKPDGKQYLASAWLVIPTEGIAQFYDEDPTAGDAK